MADISKEINDFRTAVYGRDVRNSMITLAEKVNTEVETNTANVNRAVNTANTASSRANQTLQSMRQKLRYRQPRQQRQTPSQVHRQQKKALVRQR